MLNNKNYIDNLKTVPNKEWKDAKMYPVKLLDGDLVRCDEGDHLFYSVYMVNHLGEEHCIADIYNKKMAETLEELLRSLIDIKKQ